jgi:PIN domain nuclease of toxin-antitoxin system
LKVKQGKLSLNTDPATWFAGLCARYHLSELPLCAALLCAAAHLPLIHRDPMDRVLIATALRQGMLILTSDQQFSRYPGIQTLWD